MEIEGRIYHRGEIVDAALEIDGGRIKRVKKYIPGAKRIRGVIFPGAIDLHVHFREPGYEHKEDFYTGTMSAAFGGITFLMDMPNTNPPVSDAESFNEKLRTVSRKANVDFSLYFLLNENAQILREHNAAFKLYMGETTGAKGSEVTYVPHSFISVHAELDECIKKESTNLREHDLARPEGCEVRAVKALLGMGKFHIAHVSSVDTVDMCKVGRFTCEVTPHHLLLHRDMPLGSFGKVNPPLRARWMAERLWEELLVGRIDIVASDHAPHTVEEKEEEFSSAPAGIPEVETYVPIFMRLMRMEKIPLRRMVEVLMEKPAELIGIGKGKIEKGYDADLIAMNFKDVRRVRSRDLHYKCGWTPYEGFEAIYPHTVIVGGEYVIEDGEFVGERMGKFVKIEGNKF